jgi:hypothetical protein
MSILAMRSENRTWVNPKNERKKRKRGDSDALSAKAAAAAASQGRGKQRRTQDPQQDEDDEEDDESVQTSKYEQRAKKVSVVPCTRCAREKKRGWKLVHSR